MSEEKDIHAGGHKHPFTDERVGSLLADVMRWLTNSKDVSYQEGGKYKSEIYFTVKDEYIIIGKNKIARIKDE